jgi:hypothetical protein
MISPGRIMGTGLRLSLVASLLAAIFTSTAPGVAEAGTALDFSDLTDAKIAWRRNQLTYSDALENSVWQRANGGAGTLPVVTSNYSLAPDGTMTADRVQLALNGGATAADISSIHQVANVTPGRTLSHGIWIKTNDGTTKNVQYRDDFGLTVAKVITVTPVWTRFMAENAPSNQPNVNACRMWLRGTQGTSDSADLSMWGGQLNYGPTLLDYQAISDVTSEFLAAFPLHSLFQDNAGTAAVYGIEQPIGLALDLRFGGLRGPEVNPDVGFDNPGAWTPAGTAPNWSVANGIASITATSTGNRWISCGNRLTVGKYYEIFADVVVVAGGVLPDVSASPVFATTSGRKHWILQASTQTLQFLAQPAFVGSIDNVSVREVYGCHAVQTTTGDRPVLGGLLNQIRSTEDVSNVAFWTRAGTVAVAQATGATLPAGIVSYSTITFASTGDYVLQMINRVVAVGDKWSMSHYTNSATRLLHFGGATLAGTDVYSAEDVGGGWYRHKLTRTFTAASASGAIQLLIYGLVAAINTPYLTTGVQMENAGIVGRYQRVYTAADYDAIGFAKGARFNGVNSWMWIPSLDMTGSDKLAMVLSGRKDADAPAGVPVEFSANYSANNGTFAMFTPSTQSIGEVLFAAKGTATQFPAQTGQPVAVAQVWGGIADIAAGMTILRINGVAVQTRSAPLGTGNFGSFPLYIGRRAGTSLPFNGVIYRLVVRGGAADNFIALMERWANEPVKVLA